MSQSHLQVERDDELAIVRINRPPANAIELSLVREFESLFDSLVTDDVGAVVLTGTGRFFSGGLDLKAVPYYSGAEQRELINRVNNMVGRLYGCPIPVIGAINGHALAGGLILAIACDYRVGPEADHKFGLTEVRVGIPFPAGPMAVLRGELSPADVRVVTLLGNHLGPREALARGVLDELHPPEQVLPRALALARDMARIPRQAYGVVKHQVREAALARIAEVVEQASDPMLSSWITGEAAAASQAAIKRGRE